MESAAPATALTRTGNTIKKEEFARKNGKSLRSAFLTENQHCNETLEKLRNLSCQYICFQTEIGEKSGKLHYHALIKFKNSTRFTTIKNQFPRANIQAVRNFTKAREYCLKMRTFNGTRYERNGSTIIKDERLEFQKGREIIKPNLEDVKKRILDDLAKDKEMNFWFRKYFRTEVPISDK